MFIIAKKRKPRTIKKLKNFSIGRGNDKIDIRNVKRVNPHSKTMGIFYQVDVNRGNKILHRQLKIASKNKQELRKDLEELYPKKVRLMHYKIYQKKKS